VYAVAHDDDVKINRWRKRYEQIDPRSKDPGLMRARKELERKKPTRRKTEQYWSEGQFKQLIAAGPAKLFSRSMIPYQVLVFLLTKTGTLHEVREFISKRFNAPQKISKFQDQLDFMIDNLAGLGYLTRAADGDHVTLDGSIEKLFNFRSVDPLYGAYLAEQLNRGNFDEKVQVLESVLDVSPVIARRVPLPELPKGPLQMQVIEPLMIQMGVVLAQPSGESEFERRFGDDPYAEEEELPPTFPEMLKIAFEARLAAPEPVSVQPKWIAGGAFQMDCEFFKFARSANLIKQEGIVLRHLLRLVILAGEFFVLTDDPDYEQIGELSTRCCRRVDPRYTDRFLADAENMRKLAQA
jgi:hypothetical protein